ncbi:MAG TPA: GAF domain-containing protein [Candidatus Dormibacteraeota bacterium]
MSQRSDRTLRELAALATEVGPALAPVGYEELLLAIIDTARRLFDAAACSLALLDDDADELVFHVASGAGAPDVVGLRIPAGSGIAGWVVSSGQAIAIDDVSRDPRFAADAAQSTGYVPRSILAMPLETERRLLGCIEVLDRRGGGAPGLDDMELLSVFARQAALAIEGGRVFSDLGQALLAAVAAAAGHNGELRGALERLAADETTPQRDLVELARLFYELGRLGPEERMAATHLVTELLAYARQRRAR